MQKRTASGAVAPVNDIEPLAKRSARAPLFLVLMAVLLFVSFAPLGLFSYLTVGGTRDAMVTAQQEQQLALAGNISERLDAFLEQKGREVVKLGEVLGMTNNRNDYGFLSEFLDEAVVLMRFRPVAGKSSLAVAPNLMITDPILGILERDAQLLLQQGASPGPAQAREAVLSGPHVLDSLDQILTVTVSAPVQRRGRLLGVLQEVVVLQPLWKEAAHSVPPSMRLLLISNTGALVADTHDRAGNSIEDISSRSIVQQWRNYAGRGTQRYEIVDASGRERQMLGSYSTTRFGWGVLVEVDAQVAMTAVQHQMRSVAFGGLVAAILAIAAAFVISGMISRPIARLASNAKRLADGDFSVRAHPSMVYELELLGESFNTMAANLGEMVSRIRGAARDANMLFLGVIRAFADAIDEKDPYTRGHSEFVNRYAVIIGRYMGLPKKSIKDLQVCSLLHDVGKIGIDDAILKKPAKLSDEEFEVMKTHADRGAKILSRIPQMKRILTGIRHHHERWGGGGYPDGLQGEEIPMQARIIAVADTLDAMTTDRPYQDAFTFEAAVARVNDLKGIAFDPEVVAAFNRACEAGELQETFNRRAEKSAVRVAQDEATGPITESPATQGAVTEVVTSTD